MSLFDHPDDVPTVATWRCPHCATLQPESTRCWACDRSPMTCATCRYFRRSVIGPVGFCGLDRTRALLDGDEVRSCWQAPKDLVELASDRPGSGRTSWLTVAERQRSLVSPSSSPDVVAREQAARVAPVTPTQPMEVAPAAAVGPPVAALDPASQSPIAVEPDDLVEAPLVPPARQVVSEAQRRAQARRDRLRSANDREGVL